MQWSSVACTALTRRRAFHLSVSDMVSQTANRPTNNVWVPRGKRLETAASPRGTQNALFPRKSKFNEKSGQKLAVHKFDRDSLTLIEILRSFVSFFAEGP